MGGYFIKGTGKQGIGAIITGSAYFLGGIPLSFYLAFSCGLELRGLWWGPTLAVTYNTIWYNIIIYRIDWPELIRSVREREQVEKKLREELAAQRAVEKGDDFATADEGADTPNKIN